MSATRSLTKKKKTPQPFYDTSGIRTSAKIIEEARRSVRGAVPTDRPFTPAESGRILFGAQQSQSRPPSVYSIGARHFSDERFGRPSTGQKLTPIEQTALRDLSSKASRSEIHPTTLAPIQSFEDVSSIPADPPPSAPGIKSLNTEPTLESTSKTSIVSVDSSMAKLKQSQSSPKISKRSRSAGMRVLSGGSTCSQDELRIISAEERRGQTVNREMSPDQVTGSDLNSRPLKQSSRNSSVSSIELPVWEDEIMPLLKRLDATAYDNTAELCETCDLLWTSLSKHSLLGRTGGLGGTKRRGKVLRAVFRLLDHKNPHLLLKVSRIILAMKVTSKNFLNVCKLLFAIAKSDKNDDIFKKEYVCGPLVELLSKAELGADPEALVYGLGTVKLLASNSNLRGQLGEANVVKVLAGILASCTERSHSVDKKLVRNVLVQLTGALRNLSDAIDQREQFLSNLIIQRLVKVIRDYLTDVEIVFNISRLLSKLTLQSECQVAVMQCPSLLPLLLEALTAHSLNADIIVRVCFILGNLVADDPEAREMLFFRYSALSVLKSVFGNHLSPLLKESAPSACLSGSSPTKNNTHDVLVKLVRLVANLSVHSEVGPAISQDKEMVDHLLCVLGLVSLSEQEELVLNTLATLNNLTYYSSPSSTMAQRQTELTELLLKVILVDNSDGLLECTRVFGNLSRHPEIRKTLVDNKVDEMMVALLDSDRREMVYCACGVLVNIMADTLYKESLSNNNGVRKLVEVLHDFGSSDWQLATLVCKILWNYSDNISTNFVGFGEEETSQLVQLLSNYSSESFVISYPSDASEATKQFLTLAWHKEFLPISNALLSRIQTGMSQLEPLSPEDYHK